jgi:hypothetical protein
VAINVPRLYSTLWTHSAAAAAGSWLGVCACAVSLLCRVLLTPAKIVAAVVFDTGLHNEDNPQKITGQLNKKQGNRSLDNKLFRLNQFADLDPGFFVKSLGIQNDLYMTTIFFFKYYCRKNQHILY